MGDQSVDPAENGGAWLPHDPAMFAGIPIERSAMLNELGAAPRRDPAEPRIFHLC